MLTLLVRVRKSTSESANVVSSANKSENKFVQRGKSLIYIRNRIGPKMDPCGTPFFIFSFELGLSLTNTYCSRLER